MQSNGTTSSQKESLPWLPPPGPEEQGEAGLPCDSPRGMTKGRQLWQVLRKGYQRAKQQIRNEDMKVAHLSHGLQHLARIRLVSPVRDITHDALKQQFVVLDSEDMLHFLREDGTYKSCRRAPTPMRGLLYASEVDQFVAWTEGGLQVLDSGFHLLSQVPSAVPIRCGLYSELLNRVVTAGDRNVAIWGFRYGARSLQCRLAMSEGLGPGDVFSRLALDASGRSPQRCFASCGTGVAVFDVTQGRLLSFRKELHSREITDIAYCEMVGCVVTASRDTTIKVWDENWCIQTVFVGHTAPVAAVTVYPRRPLIFSASQDGTIRTWNLDIVDQVDQVQISEPVEVLEAKSSLHVFSISGPCLSLWKVNKLYSLHTPLGVPVQRLGCANLEAAGDFPIRILCVCQDSSVRLLDAASGSVLATLRLEPPLRVLGEAYCLPRETVFLLTDDGALLRVNAAADPMVVRKSSPSSAQGAPASCLLLYHHLAEPERAHAMWLEVLESKGEKKQWQKLPLNLQDRNRFLLILGHRNGLLSSAEWFSGRLEYTVEAHGSEQVTALAEYPTHTCVISAGADLTVKMWRLFPYARECLVPLLCFSSNTLAVHMCSLGPTLAVAFQDPDTVTYSIVYYDLMEQSRAAHGPEDDPLEDITGLCCCPHLKLFASASRDGSVKVWDIRNRLLRHLKLNTIPKSLAFANHKGDLLVGIERHLYLIHHNKYLPSYYKMKLLCAKFLEPIEDVPLPLSDARFEMLVQDNLRKLLHGPPLEEPGSPPLPGTPQVPAQDSKAVREKRAKAEELARLASQAQDLQLLQKGKVSPAKRPRVGLKEAQEEAFERYLRIFHKEQPRVEIPAVDAFDADEVLEALKRVDSISELYGPHCQFLGVFPQLESLKTFHWALEEAGSSADQGPRPPPGPQGDLVGPPLQEKDKSVQEYAVGAPASEKARLRPSPTESRQLPQQLLLPPVETPQPSFPPAAEEDKGAPPASRASPASPPPSPPPRRPPSPSSPPPPPPPPPPPGPQPPVSEGVRKARIPKAKVTAVTPVYRVGQVDVDSIPDTEPAEPAEAAEAAEAPSPSQVSIVLSATADVSSSSEKSLAAEEPPPAGGSQESRKHLVSPPLSQSRSPSVTFRAFVPRQAPGGEQLQLPQDPSTLLLPRASSGFVPNSVVAQQLPSQEPGSASSTSSGRGVGPSRESWRDASGEEVASVKGEPGSASGTSWGRGVGTSRESRREASGAEVTSFSQWEPGSASGTSWGRGVGTSRESRRDASGEEVASIKGSTPRIFLTQLDESQYAEIPFFALPFKDKEWFNRLFPGGFPAGMSLNEFLIRLLEFLHVADLGTKTVVLGAVLFLQEELWGEMPRMVCDTLMALLHSQRDVLSIQDRTQRRFILTALRTLLKFDPDSQAVMVELMASYLQAPDTTRATIKTLFKEAGVEDPHGYFFQEMGRWQVEEAAPPGAVRERCSQWLEGQAQELQEHRRRVWGQEFLLAKEDAFQEGPRDRAADQEWRESGSSEGGETEGPDSSQGDQEAEEEDVPGWVGLPAVRPTDAINYFIEMQLEKELEEMRQLLSSCAEEETPKDTVMALPPVQTGRAILRLGETNTMLRRRKMVPEHPGLSFPWIFSRYARYVMKGFAPVVKLPLPKINLDPFPPRPDRPASPQTFTARQQTVQKYFIPKASCADSYP